MIKRKILVLDDSVDYTRLMKLSLESTAEFEVMIESDPLAAMAAARSFKPDVILLDYMMPGMTGGDFAGQLKNDPDLNGTPVVFLTGSVEPDAMGKIAALRDGLCLVKPAAVDDIIDAIDEALGNQG